MAGGGGGNTRDEGDEGAEWVKRGGWGICLPSLLAMSSYWLCTRKSESQNESERKGNKQRTSIIA